MKNTLDRPIIWSLTPKITQKCSFRARLQLFMVILGYFGAHIRLSHHQIGLLNMSPTMKSHFGLILTEIGENSFFTILMLNTGPQLLKTDWLRRSNAVRMKKWVANVDKDPVKPGNVAKNVGSFFSSPMCKRMAKIPNMRVQGRCGDRFSYLSTVFCVQNHS